MKRIRKYWRKWYVQLIIIMIPFALGLTGYILRYAEQGIMPDMALFSTIRLFGFMMDGEKAKEAWELQDYLLAAARWLAVIPTGNVLIRLLSPVTAQFFSEIGFRFWNLRKRRLLIFGDNTENRHLYDTASQYRPMIRCGSEEELRRLRREGVRCVQMQPETVLTAVIRKTLFSGSKACRIVINEQDEEKNLELCRIAAREVGKALSGPAGRLEALNAEKEGEKNGRPEGNDEIRALEKQINSLLERIRIVVFGEKNLESTYLELVRQSRGALKYTNKYRAIAMGLVERYPLIRFMDREKDLDKNGLVAEDMDLNVIMVGFGDTNQELFTSSMVVNQFVTGKDGGFPQMKPVNYYIYDKEPVETNKNLNHMAFRYEHEFLGAVRAGMISEDDYLPLPPDPANDHFYRTDINDQRFYEQLWRFMTANRHSANVIIVAHGTDLENIDLAQKLKAKVNEWGIGNIHIFVKVRKAVNESILETSLSEELIMFGNEAAVFEEQRLFNDELEKMTQEKHFMNAMIRSREGKRAGGKRAGGGRAFPLRMEYL